MLPVNRHAGQSRPSTVLLSTAGESILNSRELTWSYRRSFVGAAPPPPLAPAPPPVHPPPSSAAADPNQLGSALPRPVPARRMSPPPSTAAGVPAIDRRRWPAPPPATPTHNPAAITAASWRRKKNSHVGSPAATVLPLLRRIGAQQRAR